MLVFAGVLSSILLFESVAFSHILQNTTPGNLRVLTLKQYLEEFHSELIEQYMSMKTSLETVCRG